MEVENRWELRLVGQYDYGRFANIHGYNMTKSTQTSKELTDLTGCRMRWRLGPSMLSLGNIQSRVLRHQVSPPACRATGSCNGHGYSHEKQHQASSKEVRQETSKVVPPRGPISWRKLKPNWLPKSQYPQMEWWIYECFKSEWLSRAQNWEVVNFLKDWRAIQLWATITPPDASRFCLCSQATLSGKRTAWVPMLPQPRTTIKNQLPC